MDLSWLSLVVGSSIGQQVVIVGTVLVYLWLAIRRPTTARTSASEGLERFGRLFSLIVAALFLAEAIGVLLPREAVAELLGTAAGTRGVVVSGLIGGVLPGGPYAVYPLIEGVAAQGVPLAAVVTMLIGYGAIGIQRIPYGLVFFDGRTVAIRVLVGVAGTIGVALLTVVVL